MRQRLRLLRQNTVKSWVVALACLIGGWLSAASAWGQQTGGIEGVVTSNAAPQGGVAVEARSALMPRPRTAVTDAEGRYRLPMLVPGAYLLRIVAQEADAPSVASSATMKPATSPQRPGWSQSSKAATASCRASG